MSSLVSSFVSYARSIRVELKVSLRSIKVELKVSLRSTRAELVVAVALLGPEATGAPGALHSP